MHRWKRYLFTILLFCIGYSALIGRQQGSGKNYVIVPIGCTVNDVVRLAGTVVPSQRQLVWQKLEFTAFTHFTVNTFTDREWGLGTESESVFNPSAFDARQWANVCKNAGMRMIILTAKHHDGFCLWPSKYSNHTVAMSRWRNGKGDVVKEVSDACHEFGLKFGVYLSPWDRHERTYGDSPVYNEYFENQLTELLSNYGEVSEVWFDGANGEGPNGKRQTYDWKRYYEIIRRLQPNAVIFGMGPDVRWVGTESGYGRETEWSVVPDIVRNLDSIAATSPKNPVDDAFIPRDLTDEDLGSRSKIEQARTLVWYPAETDVSIRPGWFYHASEDSLVKLPDKLIDIYYGSVGRNSVLLLNIPPDRNGLIHENDVKSLMEMRRILDLTFRINCVSGASARSTDELPGHEAKYAIDGKDTTSWTPSKSTGSMEFDLKTERTFDVIAVQEDIRSGQRVESFTVQSWHNSGWETIAQGTTIGYKRLLRLHPVSTSRVRLEVTAARLNPAIAEFGLFLRPRVETK